MDWTESAVMARGGKRKLCRVPISKNYPCGQRERGLPCELARKCATQFHANIAVDVEYVALVVFNFIAAYQIVFGNGQ